MSHADRLRQYLLPITVEHAKNNSPFYAKHLAGVEPHSLTIGSLKSLPLLRKKHLEESLDELRAMRGYPDFIMYTSGTTGRAMEVPVYHEEIQAFDDLVVDTWTRKSGGDQPLTLSILRVGHGAHVLTRNIPTIPCHINYDVHQLVEFLEKKHWVNGQREKVEILDANALNLRHVTHELMQIGVNPKSFRLKAVSVSGWYIPGAERKFFEDVWGCALLDRYGVTEVNGDAKWCHQCKAYHFDFTVIPEFIDPATFEVIENGVGMVVLTGLYPFNQAVPKIRYLVEDLVEVKQAQCGSSQKSVVFLSRLAHAVKTGARGSYIYSTDIVDALFGFPDVARKEKTGFLKFRLRQLAEDGCRIEVELSYHPHFFRERVMEIESRIVSAIKRRSADMNKVEIAFLGPGELLSITKV